MSSVSLPDVVDFASDWLVGRGALVERNPDGVLFVLSPGVAQTLELPETGRLSAAPVGIGVPLSDAVPQVACGFGTPVLERLIDAARAEVPVAYASLTADAPRLPQARSLGERFSPRNGLSEVIEVGLGESEYLLAAFSWVAEADDRYEGLVSVALSAEDGGEPDAAFCAQADPTGGSRLQPRSDAAPALRAVRAAASRIERRARRRLDEALAPVLASVGRRHARDHERISEYFASMIRESRSPRRRVDPAAIRAKVEQLVAERDAKLRDLSNRFALRVSFAPAAIVRMTVSTATVRVLLRRRKESREVRLRLPALAQSLDQLACDGCSGTTSRPALCDERLHVLCETCAPNAQGRLRCPACLEAATNAAAHAPGQ